MPQCVISGAICACDCGDTPAPVIAEPYRSTNGNSEPLVTIDMIAPEVNIPSFGMCSCPTNPAVQSATSAAGGTPTPAPCVPAVLTPWLPPSTSVIAGGVPAVLSESTCMCSYGGTIAVAEMPPSAWTAT